MAENKNENEFTATEDVVAEETKTEEIKAEEKNDSVKDEVEAKINRQIEKKEEKIAKLGFYRIGEYLKEEHKWENYVFLLLSIIVMVIGGMIIVGSLEVKEDFPIIGSHSTVFAWILVGIGFLTLLYALYPFVKPTFPEFKNITWLTGKKYWGDVVRVFVFLGILVALFLLYDSFITGVLSYIFK